MSLEFYEYKVYAVVNCWSGTDPIPSTLEIPSHYNDKPVTQIREGAFAGIQELQQVLVPPTLKVIGSRAFEGCRNLKAIRHTMDFGPSILSESLESIEERAFANTGLEGMLVIRGKHLQIQQAAFEGCRMLNRVLITSEDLDLQKGIFRGCTKLKAVFGKTNIGTVPESCFEDCTALQIMSLPFRTASERAFCGDTVLDTIHPTQALKRVGKDAFLGCNALNGIPERWKVGSAKPKFIETEAAPSPEDVPLNDSTESKVKPLLKMRIKYGNLSGDIIPFHLRGFFRKFPAQEFSATNATSVKFAWNDSGSLNSFLEYLADTCCPVTLYGQCAGDYYEVTNIESTAKSGPFTNREFFQEVLRRTLAAPVHEHLDARKPYYLHTEEEFTTFLACNSATLPMWVQEAAQKELFTLKNCNRFGDNKAHAQQALEILLNVDWNPPSNLYIPDLDEAERTLNEEFTGLEEIKENFLGLIAQMHRTHSLPEENLLLVGPPGVGKTYLINTMAKILKLPVVQLDFSGIGKAQDEIMGSNRVYSNARPGTFLEGLFTHRTSTVLLFLNEVDKASERSVSDTLLPILDGAGVKEGFLEQVIPTKGNILCFASANEPSKLSPALRSRFRETTFDPYNSREKLEIWRTHALPEALTNAAVSPDELLFTPDAEELLVKQYATESGVRDVYSHARHFVRNYCLSSARNETCEPQVCTEEDVKRILGPSRQIHRPFLVHPGSVRFGYLYEGRPVLSMLEVSVTKGSGKLEILGLAPPLQKQYIRVAWKAVKLTTGFDLNSLDVTVFFTTPILTQKPDNITGLPAYLGICSALVNTPLNLADTVIYGAGIDLYGNIYLDSTDLITPLIRTMEEQGIPVLYGPPGISDRFDTTKCRTTPILLESHHGEALVRMVMANNKRNRPE